MARRKKDERTFEYEFQGKPVPSNPDGSNAHGLFITDNDLPNFDGDKASRVIDRLSARAEEALAESLDDRAERVAFHQQAAKAQVNMLTTTIPQVNSVAQVVSSNLPAPSEDGARIISAATAVAFMLAGNAYFTLRSARTGTRFTYRVSAAKPKEGGCNWCHSNPCRCPQAYFVNLLTGSDNENDYQYMGLIKERMFRRTKNSRITETAPGFKAFVWAFTRLVAGMMPAELEFWHEGRCGRCGRKLTVPESIAAGIGPECASMMEGF